MKKILFIGFYVCFIHTAQTQNNPPPIDVSNLTLHDIIRDMDSYYESDSLDDEYEDFGQDVTNNDYLPDDYDWYNSINTNEDRKKNQPVFSTFTNKNNFKKSKAVVNKTFQTQKKSDTKRRDFFGRIITNNKSNSTTKKNQTNVINTTPKTKNKKTDKPSQTLKITNDNKKNEVSNNYNKNSFENDYLLYIILISLLFIVLFFYYYSYTNNKYQDLKNKNDELSIQYFKTISSLKKDVITLKRNKTVTINKLEKKIKILKNDKSILNDKSVAFENELNSLLTFFKTKSINGEYYNNIGNSFHQLEDYKNAIKNYTKAIEINPDNNVYYNKRGNSFYQLKDYKNAIKDFTKAIEINPDNNVYYNKRGNSFYQLKDYKNAIKDFTKAIENSPNNSVYYAYRGKSYYKSNEYNKSIIDYSKAIEIQPKDNYYHILGHSQQKLGYFEKGINSFKQAIKLNPKSGWHQNCLGELYREMGKYSVAKEHFKNAITLNPEKEDYKQSLNDLLNINSTKGSLKLKKVNYTTTINENSLIFPILKLPNKDCIIKTHKYGKNQLRGYKEKDFQNLIEKYFSEEYEITGNAILLTGEHTNPYEPDIAIIGINNNIRIDIEIDEPYAGITRQATHCLGDDDVRNDYFTDRGWIVIRFSEYQVHKSANECLKFIETLINSIDNTFNIPFLANTNKIQVNEIWDLVMAQQMEKARFREEYLNIIDFNNLEQNTPSIKIELTTEEKEREKAEENEVEPTFLGKIDDATLTSFNNNNYNERDRVLKFYPKKHIYKIGNKSVPSVSTVIKRFFNEFDKVSVAQNLNALNPLYGLPTSEIIKIWDEKGRISREKGTYLHQQIENYYLEKKYDDTDVFYQFLNFVNDHNNFNIYRTEWRIFDEKYDVAGTIDLLIKNNNGTYDIYDWKRSKKIINEFGDIDYSNYNKYGIGDLSHLEDISYNQYSLQQNLYRHILETKYDITIENMYLIVMSEKLDNYVKVPVERMEDETNYILKSLKN